MVSKMATKGHLTIFIIIGSNERIIYEQNSEKVSQQYVEWFWGYSVLNPNTLNIQESLKHTWHCVIGFLRCLAAKVLKRNITKMIFFLKPTKIIRC